MSTTELLRQVKALPARERKKFLRAVRKLEDKAPPRPKKSKRVKGPDVETDKAKPWLNVVKGLPRTAAFRADTARINAVIEEEFERLVDLHSS